MNQYTYKEKAVKTLADVGYGDTIIVSKVSMAVGDGRVYTLRTPLIMFKVDATRFTQDYKSEGFYFRDAEDRIWTSDMIEEWS